MRETFGAHEDDEERNESRAERLREVWSTTFSPPQPHDYGCAVCGAAHAPIAPRDWNDRLLCEPCYERLTSPPPHLRFREEPIEGGVRLLWRVPADNQWRFFLRDCLGAAAIGYAASVMLSFGAWMFLCKSFHVPDLPRSVWLALALVPIAFALLGSGLSALRRFVRRVEVRVRPGAIDVSPSLPAGRYAVVLERGGSRIAIPVPTDGRYEAQYIVLQIESAMRRMRAHRVGYRG